eukprot:CAMPEP_0177708658 /NCGR_PEP_ID=MMETSP0484_2-20121128/10394_1 /TAXON_ID=354590 /ORGANISM="Rhodomonas lens, Strain RHODO" /LENGTH=782 /DNA_ID=CAMNT_0019220237 /DNA_START=11 /DNA_END=2359 /DNA_ORIENTATION=-
MTRVWTALAILVCAETVLCFAGLHAFAPHHHAFAPAPFRSTVSSSSLNNIHTRQNLCSVRKLRLSQVSQLRCKAEAPEKTEEQTEALVDDETRVLGSRRLAAAGKVMVTGDVEKEREHEKLLGSKRLAKATDIVMNTPVDKNRVLGSRRLRKVREIMLEKLATTKNTDSDSEERLLGSRRIQKARVLLKRTVEDMDLPTTSLWTKLTRGIRKPAIDTLEREKPKPAKPAPVKQSTAEGGQSLVSQAKAEVASGEKVEVKELKFTSKTATAQQLEQIAELRARIAALTEEESADMSSWIDNQEDVDLFRYLLGFKTTDAAWSKLKETARWRKRENIDTILSEDFSDCFEPGREEMLYLPLDNNDRPILLYRSALHDPKRLDPARFARYVTQQTERAIVQYKLGKERECMVLVDRIGSGLKNQDPALLNELVPVILNHYPYVVGQVYVAPVSPAFNIIWAILKTFLDAESQQRFVLCKGDYTATLKEFIPDSVLSDTLGGELNVTSWLLDRQAEYGADRELAKLEQDLSNTDSSKDIAFDGRPATEDEIINIAQIRVLVAGESKESLADMSNWIKSLDNGDIIRYLRTHTSVDAAWDAIKKSARWRKEEKIDNILDEDMSSVMDDGKEEFFYTGLDKTGRPVLVYRSALHTPGVIDEEVYKRYVVKRVEEGRQRFALGKDVAATVIIDRVGSGLKNQDPALLRVLIPCFTQHYPAIIGRIVVAPVNNIFFIVWSIAKILLDEGTRNSVELLKGDYEGQLRNTIDPSDIPKNLGGDLAVPEAGIL